MIDLNALRTNQAFIVGLSVIGFVLGTEFGGAWLVLGVGVVLALGTVHRSLGLFQQIYFRVLKPLGVLKPDIKRESPSPHRFAQGVGAVFSLASGLILLLTPLAVLGWILAWIVIVLAAINLTIGFCAGCFMYYHLDRLGLMPSVASDRAHSRSAV